MWVVMGAVASLLVLFISAGPFLEGVPLTAVLLVLLVVLVWRPRPWLYLVGGIVSLLPFLLFGIFILPVLLKPVGAPDNWHGFVIPAAGLAGFVAGIIAFREARRRSWTRAALGPRSAWAAVAVLIGLVIGASYVSVVGSSSGGAGIANGVTDAPTQAPLILTASNTRFVEHSLQGKSGVTSLYVVNKDSSFHTFDIVVDGQHYSYPLAGKSTTGVVLKLGNAKYTYWCAVGNHRQNGMEGTIQTSSS
jgi:hypothetical protein